MQWNRLRMCCIAYLLEIKGIYFLRKYKIVCKQVSSVWIMWYSKDNKKILSESMEKEDLLVWQDLRYRETYIMGKGR